jgi:hypothetical protein
MLIRLSELEERERESSRAWGLDHENQKILDSRTKY